MTSETLSLRDFVHADQPRAMWGDPVTYLRDAAVAHVGQIVKVLLPKIDLLSDDLARKHEIRAFAVARPVIEKIAGFAELHHGWYAEEFAPISKIVLEMAADQALEFAELAISRNGLLAEVVMPDTLPTTEGGIQFEWHHKGLDLEIELLPSGRKYALLEREGQPPVELDLSAGFAEIAEELADLLAP